MIFKFNFYSISKWFYQHKEKKNQFNIILYNIKDKLIYIYRRSILTRPYNLYIYNKRTYIYIYKIQYILYIHKFYIYFHIYEKFI